MQAIAILADFMIPPLLRTNKPFVQILASCAVVLLLQVDCRAAGTTPNRPQEPKKPVPYREQEVVVTNSNSGVRLAGTLSIPRGEGPYPAVLLISGSGPQNRDEEILGHRPFLVLADNLVRQSVVVLRLDDRGVAKSTGNYDTALNRDFAEDAVCAVKFLKRRREVAAIGLIGHSLGGALAPLVAQKTEVRFIVSLAGPGLKGVDFITQRDRFLLEFAHVTLPSSRLETTTRRWKTINDVLMSDLPAGEAAKRIRPILEEEIQELTGPERELLQGLGMELKADVILKEINTPWYRDNLKFDPGPGLRALNCPVLALYGDKDIFVPAEANSHAVEKALKIGGSRSATVKILPGMNHFFQISKTGMPLEAYQLEETISPEVLKIIADWIGSQTSRL